MMSILPCLFVAVVPPTAEYGAAGCGFRRVRSPASHAARAALQRPVNRGILPYRTGKNNEAGLHNPAAIAISASTALK
jgi:hypothetical protein